MPARTARDRPGETQVTDPYNSYTAHMPAAAPAVVAPRVAPAIDRISRLDVSESWKQRFRLIERAGGIAMKHARDLDPGERRGLTINWMAFFFGPFYFLAKGLWRQALGYLLVWIGVVVVCVLMHWEGILRPMGIGFNVAYSMRANVGYYARVVLGEPIWF
jgi:hypothetical protein